MYSLKKLNQQKEGYPENSEVSIEYMPGNYVYTQRVVCIEPNYKKKYKKERKKKTFWQCICATFCCLFCCFPY
jgi:hypothetical protein